MVGTAAGIRTDGAAHETYKETLKFEVQALRDGHVFLFVCLAVRLFACRMQPYAAVAGLCVDQSIRVRVDISATE